MNISKRNPMLRNNECALDSVIGNLGQEIQEQQLSNIDGGTSIPCSILMVEISCAASSACCAAASVSAVWGITNAIFD